MGGHLTISRSSNRSIPIFPPRSIVRQEKFGARRKRCEEISKEINKKEIGISASIEEQQFTNQGSGRTRAVVRLCKDFFGTLCMELL